MKLRYILKLGFIFIAKCIPSKTPILILKGPLRKFKWITDASPGEAKGLSVILNMSESDQMKFALKSITRTKMCFDIGANVGLYTLLFARYSKFVYAFEPIPRNIRYLDKIMRLNKIHNVKIVPYAISDINGHSWMEKPRKEASFRLADKGNFHIKTITLDTFIKTVDVQPYLIKIDVEGAEYRVLEGGKRFLSNNKPIILLSTHSDDLKAKCLNYLKLINYSIIKPINAKEIKNATEFFISR
ncbi:hypothetical protein LCGC14_2626610 [marine sediment metagenome]|uniref:Methyltransferase FkbM domain-containing protein n=1 Tax=marine sediment metagenome TaxID=412755 RepID=A0A0F9CCJ9_9ZZZZ